MLIRLPAVAKNKTCAQGLFEFLDVRQSESLRGFPNVFERDAQIIRKQDIINLNFQLKNHLLVSLAVHKEGWVSFGFSEDRPRHLHPLFAAPTKVNCSYIRAAAITLGIGGEAEVRNYHLSLFDERNAVREERCHRLRENFKSEVTRADLHIEEFSALKDRTPPYQEQPSPGVPWTAFSRVQAVFFISLSALLLAVGINSNALVLMASGIPGFEHPIRAYLFSVIPIGIAAALKALGSHLESPRSRRNYMVGVWVVALLFGLVWARLFAATFPGLTQSAADIVRSLSASTNSQSHGPSSGGLVFVAILAEAFLAAGCWLTVQTIFEEHQQWMRRDNPAYRQVEQELEMWRRRRSENNELEGITGGRLRQIANARGRFIADAAGQFLAAVRLTANDKHLDDYLNGCGQFPTRTELKTPPAYEND